MKKAIFKNAMLALLALLLCVAPLSGCNQQEETPEPTTAPVQKETFMTLLGFDSYEEITGTKLAMGNMLGRMDINTDAQYLTQGSGSVKLTVQGNYDEPAEHPYFKLDFLNTSCATCDFSQFKNISFDVYNASDVEQHIKVSINVGKEDGNYIGTAKETFTLKPKSWNTCTYDLSAMAGFSLYDFTSVRYMTVEFMEHKENREAAASVFYFDNLIGNYFAEGEQPQTFSFDFYEGIDFETAGNELLFTGQGKDNDAALERANYEALGMEAPENGGSYGLRLSHETNLWPTFRINFGKELEAGTVISFDAYGRINGESIYNQCIFEYSDGGEATVQFNCDVWTKVSFTLKKAGSYVDLFWNIDRAMITSDKASGEVFIDNMIATPPVPPIEPEGNFWDGIDFEIPGNAGLFVGQKIEGAEKRDATIERVAYSDLEIPALTNGGEYALKLSHDSNYWPTFRINFGETLPKGTVITFQAYAQITIGASNYNQSIFEYSAGGEATEQFKCDAWTELKMELPESAEYIDLFWNYDRAGITSATAAAEVYIDNVIATPGKPPVDPVGDFMEGIDFETSGNEAWFGEVGGENAWREATLERVAYSDISITAPANGGSYALKLTCEKSQWPVFRINFGKTLKAGTVISFQAYSRDISDPQKETVSIFESIPGESYLVYTGANGATNQYFYNSWNDLAIVLAEDRAYVDLVCTMDRWNEPGPANLEVYMDNFKAAEPAPPVDPTGDFLEGIDFETEGNEAWFGAVGGENAWRDATLTRVNYADTGMTAPANGGEYALKITCANSQWPVFRIDFGKTLKAGTVISFQAYSRDTADAEKETVSIFENLPGESYLVQTSANGATDQYFYNSWKDLTIVLAEDRAYVDLMCNMDRWGEPGPANLEVYMDNFKATEPAEPVEPIDPVGDFTQGIDFETEGNEQWFVGGENAWQAATLERIAYAEANVAAPANGGSYALKVSHASNCWPNFRVNFGKTLKAGTTITFDVYGNYDYEAAEGVNKYVKLELSADSKNFATSEDPNQVLWTLVETWRTGVTITLTAESDHVDFFYNVADGQHGDVASWLLLDNFKAVEPADPTEPGEPVGDFTQGIDFETAGNELWFVGGENEWQAATIERVSYADANVAAPEGGSYALKVSHTSQCWPSFRVNFGKTLKAGTTITFDVYGNYDYQAAAGVNKYMKLELSADSKNFATSEDPNQIVWTLVETWKTATITLTADSDHVDFFYNVADGQHGEVSSWLLLDNFKAVEPADPTEPVGDFTQGIDFETAGNELWFVGGENEWQAATIERVSYANANVAAPEGGSYAVKVSHTSQCWPTFRVNFGKTLKAGTTITFDVYGNYDYQAAAGVNKYMKLELSADSKNFAESEDPNQVVWTLVETWKTATITLTADSDHVDFFYNVADGQHGEVSSWLLLDNFKAVEPEEPTEPDDGFPQDIDFETAGDEQWFTGQGAPQDATIERVSYASANVAAPANGGSYALKISHTGHCWPSFRVNFGKTLKAGTTITFDVYGNYDYQAAAGVNKYVKLELSAGSKSFAESEDPNQIVWTLVETWKTATITLTAESDHVDFFYNVADGQHGDVPSWILLDNFKAVEPAEPTEPDDSLTQDVDFETAGDEQWFTGQGAPQDATIERVSYASANVAAPANGGSYALKISHTGHCWPSFRVNFGKTLAAGTTITFDFYGNYDYQAPAGVNKYMKLELSAGSKNFAESEDPNQIVWTLVETWKTATVTLTADSDHVDFFYNVADGQHGEVASWILLDNFKAVEPVSVDRIDFEEEADAAFFTGLGIQGRDAAIERVTYAALGIDAPANGGSYALKLSHDSNYWPTFRINFGKVLGAGTKLTFDAYGKINGETLYNQSIFEYTAGGEATEQFVHDGWKTLIITLESAADHIDLFWNYDRANIQSTTASGEVYIDNMIVEEP